MSRDRRGQEAARKITKVGMARRNRVRFRPTILERLEERLVMTTGVGLSTVDVSAVYHGNVTLSANLTTAPGGAPIAGVDIDFFVAGVEYDGNITASDGTASLVVSVVGLSAGTYMNGFIANFAGNGTYSGATADNNLTINPAPVTVSVDTASKVYGQANPAFTPHITGVFGPDTVTASYITSAAQFSDVSSYPITFTGLGGSASSDYSVSVAGGSFSNNTLTVTPAPLTVVASANSKVYGQANPTLSGSVSGVYPSDAANVTVTFVTSAGTSSGVGTYPIGANYSGAKANDYSTAVSGGSFTPASFTVTPAALTITANNQTKVYGAALPTLTASYTGLVNGDTSASLTTSPTIVTAATAASHVAGSPFSITASGAVGSNYTISYVAGNLSVTAAPLTITANNQTKVYGAALPTLTANYTGFVNGDTAGNLSTPPTITTGATAASHVASSPFSIIPSGAVDSDYTISYVPGSLAITPAPLTITANDQTKVYGAALPTLTASYTGFVNGDTPANLVTPPALTTSATAVSSVAGSPYTISAGGGSDSDYTISYIAGSLSVTPAPLTITANDQTKVYGDALPTLTASYTGFVNGDTSSSLTTQPGLVTTATASSHVAGSPYAITASGANDSNYTISYVAGSLTVTAAPLTITADDQSKVYGDAVPTLLTSYSGFVNGDTAASLVVAPTLTTTAATSSPVSGNPYTITIGGAVDSDYTIAYAAGVLTVTPAALVITADDQTKLYGAASPTLTASFTGFVNGDTSASLTTAPSLATTADATSHVASSPYAITASGAVDPNYTISYAPGSLTVTAVPLTITVSDQAQVYGAAVPTLTASYTGFVNGDTAASLATAPSLSTTADATSHVGSYAITASGAVDPDYTISYAAGSLVVTPATLTITADDLVSVYGSALPTLTASYTGFVNGDTAASLTTQPSLSTTGTASSHVGTYAVTASGADDPDYTISYAAGSLAVTAASLTITADDKSKVYGDAVPTLSASYAGFVNGDTAASLATGPGLSTTAEATSHVGSYAVTASGAVDPDYTISYAAGSLAVTPASLVITADDQTSTQGAGLPTLTASYSGFVNGDTAASLTTPPSLSTTGTASSPVGSYAITASGAIDPDYAISYVAGNLAVTAAVTPTPTTVSGKVYLDLNGDGTPTAGEPGLAGRVVFLDLNGDGILTAGEPTATTDSDGNFTLTSTAGGTGPVVEATDQDATYRNVVSQTVTNADGTVSIGVVPITSIAPVQVVPNPFTANPSPDANTAYVQSLYRAVLGRDGADSEVAGWLASIAQGATRLEVAEGFVNSPEHRMAQVDAYYEEFLGRAVDPFSAGWVDALLAGASEESVVEGILDSAEYQSAHQDSTVFIQALYTEVLGRQGEAAGVDFWQSALTSGASRDSVVAGFVESAEVNGQIVSSDYTSFLRRPRESGTTSDVWVEMLDTPGGSATEVAEGILASDEFNLDATTPES